MVRGGAAGGPLVLRGDGECVVTFEDPTNIFRYAIWIAPMLVLMVLGSSSSTSKEFHGP